MAQSALTMDSTDLPNAAYHPSTDDFEAKSVNEKESPNTVAEVEQLIRVAFALGGRNDAIDLARKAVEFQQEYEKEHVFSDFTVDRAHAEETNDVWLQDTLNDFADKRQEIYNEEKDMYDRRMHWYNNDVIDWLEDKIDRATSMLHDGVEFKAVEVVRDAENAVEDENVISVDRLSGMDISEFGYTPPVTLMVCVSPDSGSIYPFVPWCGTTVCTGPAKHENPVSTLCKHEIAALIKYSQDQFDPDGRQISERFKRLMAPEAYNRFMENISP